MDRRSYPSTTFAKNAATVRQIKISSPESPRWRTLLERVGWRTTSALVMTTGAVLAVVGFVGFLWFANVDDAVWHWVIIEGWATRSVTISTLILRFATDIQAGFATAMLAALILESSSVPLHRVGQVSTMRATNPQPKALLEILPAVLGSNGTSHHLTSMFYCFLIVALVTTTTALQFSSTILLSDLGLGQLPSSSYQRTVPFDFNYTTDAEFKKFGGGVGKATSGNIRYPLQPKIATWSRSPASFPAFAEYSKPFPAEDGIDDTGTLLRAFLPFADAQTRENLRTYSGTAMVLDSRVSCQRPKLADVSLRQVHSWTTGTTTATLGRMTGSFRPSKPNVERLWTPDRAVPFNCSLLLNDEALMLCQITATAPLTDSYIENGGLLSEFWNVTNVQSAIGEGLAPWQLPFLVFRAGNISSTHIDSDITGKEDEGIWANVITDEQTWSISICYSSWVTADLNVDMHSNRNRSEPIALWNMQRGYYTEPNALAQLGSLSGLGGSSESRGILQLAKKTSWIPDWEEVVPNQIQPFVQQFADIITSDSVVSQSCLECSTLLPPPFRGDTFELSDSKIGSYYSNYIFPLQMTPNTMFQVDNALSSIFHDAFKASGSLARAMSTLITVLSSMAYYDQMPAFDQKAETTQVSFVTVLLPQSHLGLWGLGFTLFVHSSLINCVVLIFALRSRHTLLGNYWQAIAQIIGPETENIISASREASDKAAENEIRATGNEDARVGIRFLKERRMVGMSVVKREVASAADQMVISKPIF